MGGRTATMLISGAALAAMAVLVWSVASALSLVEASPYWLGSLGVTMALAATLLILKDLVLWPFKRFGPALDRLRNWITGWFAGFKSREPEKVASVKPARPPARREH